MLQIDLAEIGNRISVERRRNNITQEQLAEKMNVSIQILNILASSGSSIMSGQLSRCSHFDTACVETPAFSANSSCVNPFSLR